VGSQPCPTFNGSHVHSIPKSETEQLVAKYRVVLLLSNRFKILNISKMHLNDVGTSASGVTRGFSTRVFVRGFCPLWVQRRHKIMPNLHVSNDVNQSKKE